MPKRARSGTLQGVIAANVRRLRTARGLSQEGLAHVCGYRRTYVGGIERGERNISIGTLEALAGALGAEPPFDSASRPARRSLRTSGEKRDQGARAEKAYPFCAMPVVRLGSG